MDIEDFNALRSYYKKGHGDSARPGFEKANIYRIDTPTYPASDVVDISDFVMMKKGYKRCNAQNASEHPGGPDNKMCQVCDNDDATPEKDCGYK